MSTAADATSTLADWAAPKADGEVLVWPDRQTLPDVARDNKQRLDASDATVLGRTLGEHRRDMRQFLGLSDDDGPVVMTGHQCELLHPGVWVKDAVIHAVAEACEGVAWHVAVDTDGPKHLTFKWPGYSRKLSDDPRLYGVAWTGRLDPPTPAHIDQLEADADQAQHDGLVSPHLAEWIADLRRYLIDQRDSPSPLTLPGAMTNANHRLDWSLGLRYSTTLASGLCESPTWVALVLHLATNAASFADSYNAALAENRRLAGISDPDRPMPDLDVDVDVDEIELPYWLDDLATGGRSRARVDVGGDRPRLIVAGERVELPEEPMPMLMLLRRLGLRLGPRALSLTMFLRLFASDLFVHGIGGGHYDQVLDAILRDHLGLEPPTFAVASATLFHPDAGTRERVCLNCLDQRGHRLRHDVLGDEKQAWLAKIDAAEDETERRQQFDAMHAARRQRLATDDRYAAWRRDRDEAERRQERDAAYFDRELFYGLQPTSRLIGLLDHVRGA